MLAVKCFVKSLSNRYSDVNISALVMRVSNSNMLLSWKEKRMYYNFGYTPAY